MNVASSAPGKEWVALLTIVPATACPFEELPPVISLKLLMTVSGISRDIESGPLTPDPGKRV